MTASSLYTEETFGILTDDDLYLACVLVKPAALKDEELRVLRAWVPKYPMTKSSVITCARQEVKSYGREGRIAHLVFDLRGTGESEGRPGDKNFQMDLVAIKAWAEERFGAINFGFLGLPEDNGQLQLSPIRPGVVLENYRYPAAGETSRPPILYLATYGNFGRSDDALCVALSQAGYPVYGLDPLRFLLHASASSRLNVSTLWQDVRTFCDMLPGNPLVIGQPISAGLALLWAAGIEALVGVIAIGRAQAAFNASHIFDTSNFHSFFLSRYIYQISPRPVAVVQHQGQPLGGDGDELDVLYETCGEPRRLEQTREITPDFLLQLLNWLQNVSKA